MKRLAAILIAGGAVWLFLAAGAVFADNGPHMQRSGGLTADSCAGCHRAHTAGSEMLTIKPQPALCFDCHGSTAAGSTTRVENGTGTGANAGALRGGGIQFALVDSGNPSRIGFGPGNGTVPALAVGSGAATTSHHAVDFDPEVIWGNGPISSVTPNAGTQTELRCGSCHNPHGERTYRILRANPVDSGVTTAQRVYVTDVTDWEPDANVSLSGNQAVTVGTGGAGTYQYNTTNYWRPQDPNWKGTDFVLQGDTFSGTGAITLGQDSKDFLGATSKWCATCHTRYMADSGAYEVDSTDKIFAFRHPVWGTSDGTPNPANASDRAPACLQCHVSHGSNAAMGSNSASVTEPGSSTVPAETSRLLRVNSRGVCQMCHFK